HHTVARDLSADADLLADQRNDRDEQARPFLRLLEHVAECDERAEDLVAFALAQPGAAPHRFGKLALPRAGQILDLAVGIEREAAHRLALLPVDRDADEIVAVPV